MPLFQKTILQKHLRALDVERLEKHWKVFTDHFHNPVIQQNIRNSNEEQYQEGFVEDLFVRVLGYVKNPAPDFNFITEQKNQGDAKKADGAILIDGNVRAVVELKGTNTTDLGKIEGQVFGYKNRQPGCDYVVLSNYEKIRFYIENAVEYLEFNLFELTRDEFALLWLCLSYDSISTDLPLRLKNESISAENEITKALYHDYSVFRRELFNDLIDKNPDIDKLLLFKKTQKLLDRFLFIFFAEDRLLLPVNLIKNIIAEWEKLRDMRVDYSLYERFKLYFNDLNTGNPKQDIFAYNGGLFQPDDILDNLELDDRLLFEHTHRLSTYDFESEIDVNILGHIFENSLNEIEELENQVIRHQVEGIPLQVTKTSKRKKDGVFYTPRYITKYIVDNTLGKLCAEKKEELEISDEHYVNVKRRSQSRLENLRKYRDWLLQLSICDPACGSGAFLNQALDFLIEEHRYVDELSARYHNDPLVLSDIESSILENNLYGVDINEESVHIAKLSLWLRTAQRDRKLNNLNQNIKCGNSLINDPKIAGDKAFNWEKEFPQVFEKGGFDVVIGNPPYVQSHAMDEPMKNYFYSEYNSAEYQINLYTIFIEKITQILNNHSIYSIIVPNYWMSTKYDSKLRELIFLKNRCLELLNVFQVFEDATVDTVILTGIKTEIAKFPKTTELISINPKLSKVIDRLKVIGNKEWHLKKQMPFKSITDDTLISFEEKFEIKGNKTLGDYLDFKKGMQPYEKGKGQPEQTREMMNERVYNSPTKLDPSYKILLKARNVQRYFKNGTSGYIKYGINLAAPRNPEIFTGPRILINRILSKKSIDGFYTEEYYINNSDIFNLIPKDENISPKALSALILSPLCAAYFKKQNINLNRAAFPKLNVNTLEKFPIPELSDETEKALEESVDSIMQQIENLESVTSKFSSYFSGQYGLSNLSRKLESWHELEFSDFIKELNKAINKEKVTPLTKKEGFEWMELFETNKVTALDLQAQISATDQEIDRIVYELYGLTEEEIAIVENS